jgi:transglutaminase-like putative cysteine protease
MRLTIRHATHYTFAGPVFSGLQQLRLTPLDNHNQKVTEWNFEVERGTKQLSFSDQFGNHVDLVSLESNTTEIKITCTGTIELTDTHGIVGPHKGLAPLWLYKRQTDRTRAGVNVRRLARQVEGDTDLNRMHNLKELVADAVTYQPGRSEPDWTAEDAIIEGHGVCQDHTHVFVACARALDLPARYVSGYLLMNDRTEQEAMHAWAEVHLPDLGWVGFDASNRISPDKRYVRVATGLDYSDAAPVTGTRIGGAEEALSVEIEIAQQQ